MADNVIRFDTIQFIETLKPGDRRTGFHTFEDVEPLGIRSTPPLRVEYRQVRTREELFGRLATIKDDLQLRGHSPIVHIDCHGGESGIETTSGELASWSELKPALQAINIMSNLNLIVVMAACSGAHLLSIMQVTDRAPYRMMIGPHEEVRAGEMERASLAFYRELIGSRNGGATCEAMKAVAGLGGWGLGIYTAQGSFRHVLRGYFRHFFTPEALTARRRMFMTQARADHPTASLETHARAAGMFETLLLDKRRQFEDARNTFFLCDLASENLARFDDVRFEDCLPVKDNRFNSSGA